MFALTCHHDFLACAFAWGPRGLDNILTQYDEANYLTAPGGASTGSMQDRRDVHICLHSTMYLDR